MPHLDSRLRGNDELQVRAAVEGRTWIPACAGMTVGTGDPLLGTRYSVLGTRYA